MGQGAVQFRRIADIVAVDLDDVVLGVIQRRFHIIGDDGTVGDARIQIRGLVADVRSGRIILQILLQMAENVLRGCIGDGFTGSLVRRIRILLVQRFVFFNQHAEVLLADADHILDGAVRAGLHPGQCEIVSGAVRQIGAAVAGRARTAQAFQHCLGILIGRHHAVQHDVSVLFLVGALLGVAEAFETVHVLVENDDQLIVIRLGDELVDGILGVIQGTIGYEVALGSLLPGQIQGLAEVVRHAGQHAQIIVNILLFIEDVLREVGQQVGGQAFAGVEPEIEHRIGIQRDRVVQRILVDIVVVLLLRAQGIVVKLGQRIQRRLGGVDVVLIVLHRRRAGLGLRLGDAVFRIVADGEMHGHEILAHGRREFGIHEFLKIRIAVFRLYRYGRNRSECQQQRQHRLHRLQP